MKELAIMLRTKQLLAHNGHNMVSGVAFMQDHEFLGELYPEYESAYDSVIERIIGLYGHDSLDIIAIQTAAVQKLAQYPNSEFFNSLLHCEKEMCSHIEKLCKVAGVTQGTINLLADIADKSEVRQYKLKARLM